MFRTVNWWPATDDSKDRYGERPQNIQYINQQNANFITWHETRRKLQPDEIPLDHKLWQMFFFSQAS